MFLEIQVLEKVFNYFNKRNMDLTIEHNILAIFIIYDSPGIPEAPKWKLIAAWMYYLCLYFMISEIK